MKNQFESFIKELSRVELPENVFNQYSNISHANSIRRKNLFLYLGQMAAFNSKIMLVGEAPSHRGCRLTGIPFTSEFILLNGIEEIGLFGASRGYEKTSELEKISKEQSATIVWNTLAKFNSIPLLWNALPFHPFKYGNIFSNRTPTNNELKIGGAFLKPLIQLFNIQTIVAVGNKAEMTLKSIEVNCQKIRHPAQGGKADFVKGITYLMTNDKISNPNN